MRDAQKQGIKNIEIDIYDKKDFSVCGPKGCNNCGGIIAESLIQEMALDGIKIPKTVLQEGVDAYKLHTDVGSVLIKTPLEEKRIASVYRGAGPLNSKNTSVESFDDFLRKMVISSGANLIPENVKSVSFDKLGKPIIANKQYDLLVGAVGINSNFLQTIQSLEFGYAAPKKTKTKICEIYLGKDRVEEYFGSSMHVFLLDIPKLRFAAIIPKENYVTVALLSSDIVNQEMMNTFLSAPSVKSIFPKDVDLLKPQCQCSPGMNVGEAIQPYADRVVLIGDSASAKLYKNGIGAAYITAREAAETAILNGISKKNFANNYAKACAKIDFDNKLGSVVFFTTSIIQKVSFLKRAVLRNVEKEQDKPGLKRHMSIVLWDTFTGSSSYADIFIRALKPSFLLPFISSILFGGELKKQNASNNKKNKMQDDVLGKVYKDGETILQEGTYGDTMYIIQAGTVSVSITKDDKKVTLNNLQTGDYFGEMALLGNPKRSASVHSIGESTILTIDKKYFLKKIKEDPFRAIDILEKLSSRVKEGDLFEEIALCGNNISSTLATTNVELKTVKTKQELQEVLQNNPKLTLLIMEKMFDRIKETNEKDT